MESLNNTGFNPGDKVRVKNDRCTAGYDFAEGRTYTVISAFSDRPELITTTYTEWAEVMDNETGKRYLASAHRFLLVGDEDEDAVQ